MTYQTDCTLPEELLEQIAQRGMDVLLRGLDRILFLQKFFYLVPSHPHRAVLLKNGVIY
jgi:hypothetical protein